MTQLNVSVCIFEKQILRNKSKINTMLEKLQSHLKEECRHYKRIQVAFIYETPELDVCEISNFTADTPVYYKEPCEYLKGHDLFRVWLIGMVLLEGYQCQAGMSCENRLYILTDEVFSRVQVNRIVRKKGGQIKIHPRFKDLDVKPILIRTPNAGGDNLEAYMREQGKVYVIEEEV